MYSDKRPVSTAKLERAVAYYSLRNAHQDITASASYSRIMNPKDESHDRFEIFDRTGIGALPVRRRYRNFINYSSCDQYDILSNKPRQAEHTHSGQISIPAVKDSNKDFKEAKKFLTKVASASIQPKNAYSDISL